MARACYRLGAVARALRLSVGFGTAARHTQVAATDDRTDFWTGCLSATVGSTNF